MRNIRVMLTMLCCVLFFAGVLTATEIDELETTLGTEPCCFENPRYSGTCQVTPGPEESCADILAYLNNPNSVGKTYCGNTKVRGGWTEVSCEESTSATTTESCAERRE